jgi:tRNA1Val (adenine37-N6)-methyltransferase
MESFYFKKFTVDQGLSAMKVNTDGVLLGAWLSIPESKSFADKSDSFNVLDIGTGTGVISLIIAQRLSYSNPSEKVARFFIDAIDIDKPSIVEATNNFNKSCWASNLQASEISLQDTIRDTKGEKYHLLVSNPPYFIDSLKAPCVRRSSARHNDNLPYDVIIEAASLLLVERGVLAIVLPANEGDKFMELVEKTHNINNLHLSRICKVKTIAGKKEKRYLMEFVKSAQSTALIQEELIMQETGGVEYTQQYKNLTKDLYLRF